MRLRPFEESLVFSAGLRKYQIYLNDVLYFCAVIGVEALSRSTLT